MGRTAAAVHVERITKAISSGDAASSAVAASWRRSGRLHALDPANNAPSVRLTDAEIAAARERLGPLPALAQSHLDRLFQAVGGVGCSVLLADVNGVVLERRGAPCDDTTFDSWGLWTGAVWSEKLEGTNGIGTCLFEQRSVTIDRDQHFYARIALLACTTAPIYDERGDLVAALDVSSCRADLTAGFARLIATAVLEAARAIEVENFRVAFPHARVLLAPVGERAGPALLAVDRDDLLAGATRAARQALGITAQTLARPRPAADVIGLSHSAGDNIDAAERAVLIRALARSGGNVSKAANLLNLSRATLHRRMNQLGLHRCSG